MEGPCWLAWPILAHSPKLGRICWYILFNLGFVLYKTIYLFKYKIQIKQNTYISGTISNCFICVLCQIKQFSLYVLSAFCIRENNFPLYVLSGGNGKAVKCKEFLFIYFTQLFNLQRNRDCTEENVTILIEFSLGKCPKEVNYIFF